MDKLKRSSGDGVDGLQTEVVQLQVEMENMSQKYMEEIENLKVCFTNIFPRPLQFYWPLQFYCPLPPRPNPSRVEAM